MTWSGSIGPKMRLLGAQHVEEALLVDAPCKDSFFVQQWVAQLIVEPGIV